MAKVLIVYATRTGGTKAIAESIGQGLLKSDVEVTIVDAKAVRGESDLEGYDAYLFGSATYHGEMMHPMKQVLFIAERARLSGKAGGAFGAYGWSGEAPQRIHDTMKNLYRMNMVDSPLRVQIPARSGFIEEVSHAYGSKLIDKIRH